MLLLLLALVGVERRRRLLQWRRWRRRRVHVEAHHAAIGDELRASALDEAGVLDVDEQVVGDLALLDGDEAPAVGEQRAQRARQPLPLALADEVQHVAHEHKSGAATAWQLRCDAWGHPHRGDAILNAGAPCLAADRPNRVGPHLEGENLAVWQLGGERE